MILAAVHLEDPNVAPVWFDIQDGQEIILGGNPALPKIGPAQQLLRIPWGAGNRSATDPFLNSSHSRAWRRDRVLLLQRLPAGAEGKSRNRFYSVGPPLKRSPLEDTQTPLQLLPGDTVMISAQGKTALVWLENAEQLSSTVQALRVKIRPAVASAEKGGGFAAIDRTTMHWEEDALPSYTQKLQVKLFGNDLLQMLSGWSDPTDLMSRATGFIRGLFERRIMDDNSAGTASEIFAAFIAVEKTADGSLAYEVLSDLSTHTGSLTYSRTLLQQAYDTIFLEARPSVWMRESSPGFQQSLAVTTDWVIIHPLIPVDEGPQHIYQHDNLQPVCLYVAGLRSTPSAFHAAAPMIRLVCGLVNSVLATRRQQRTLDTVTRFFSPALHHVVRNSDRRELDLGTATCTVLFCDRPGSSLGAEGQAEPADIIAAHEQNRRFLEIVVREVFEHGGVVADFAGDSVLAFWGWPASAAQGNHASAAVSAAGKIVRCLSQLNAEDNPGEKQSGLPCRIGICTGPVAVGRIGPDLQMKIGVFGHPVNLAARLEGFSSVVRLPVLMSKETVDHLAPNQKPLLRKLCRFIPKGFSQSYEVHELVLPREIGGSGASADQVKFYDKALEEFRSGRFQDCRVTLRAADRLGNDTAIDEANDFLRTLANDYSRRPPPPPDWDGAIPAESK